MPFLFVPSRDFIVCARSLFSDDMMTDSAVAILQPHTSSPFLRSIAHGIITLITNIGDDDLRQNLNAQLDYLAISLQAKQAIIPALLGIVRLTEVQPRR